MNLKEIVQRVYDSPSLRSYLKLNISGDPKAQKNQIRLKVAALARKNPMFTSLLVEQVNKTPVGE